MSRSKTELSVYTLTTVGRNGDFAALGTMNQGVALTFVGSSSSSMSRICFPNSGLEAHGLMIMNLFIIRDFNSLTFSVL